MQASTSGQSHQGMVRGVKFHIVHAVAKSVMAAQLRRMHIGQPGMGLHGVGAKRFTQHTQATSVQQRRIEFERVLQRAVARKQVVVD